MYACVKLYIIPYIYIYINHPQKHEWFDSSTVLCGLFSTTAGPGKHLKRGHEEASAGLFDGYKWDETYQNARKKMI